MEYEDVTHTKRERRLGRLPSGTDITVTVTDTRAGSGRLRTCRPHSTELNSTGRLRCADFIIVCWPRISPGR